MTWRFKHEGGRDGYCIFDDDNFAVAEAFYGSGEGKEVARHIVACVNACAGIPTEDLERWGVRLIDKIREDDALMRDTDGEGSEL